MRRKIAVYIEDGLLVCYIRFLESDGGLLLILRNHKKSTTLGFVLWNRIQILKAVNCIRIAKLLVC